MKVCVVGIGKLGYSIATALLNGGNDVTIIDNDMERIQNVGSNLDAFTVQGDAIQIDALKEIDIASHDLIIATTEEDEKNMIICAFAKKLGCPRAMARVRSPEHLKQLDFIKETIGIDRLLNPDYSCAREIFKYLTQQDAIEGGLFVQDGIAILEFKADRIPSLEGKKLMDSKKELENILIGAISRKGKILIPNGSSVIEPGDTLYVAGLEKDIFDLNNRLRTKEKAALPKRVMIAGGGKTGLFLAKMLEEKNISVKIIEIDQERCNELAAELGDSIVLNGDASDIDVLRDEGLDSMDAFVAATGFDEENLLLSLLVRRYGINEVVAKVSRQTFIPIIKQLGTSAIINPQEIIASDVLASIRRSGIVLFSKLINGQAEFTEIQAESSMPLVKKTLADLDIPDGVIILAVRRGKSIIIPNGKTQVATGDKVILLSLLSSRGELEALLTKSQSSIL
ncbi:MAG: Trk system potassium transporter TrkA [Firmicutes bacterium]|nr:Trk system potassium transporter TrkA [Bacillota bacterium]